MLLGLGYRIVLSSHRLYVSNSSSLCIGEGSFAKVYIGRHLFTGEDVVIKAVDKKKVLESNVYTEIEVLRKVSHPYIMRLYAAYEQGKLGQGRALSGAVRLRDRSTASKKMKAKEKESARRYRKTDREEGGGRDKSCDRRGHKHSNKNVKE